jgi:hypothetical protein
MSVENVNNEISSFTGHKADEWARSWSKLKKTGKRLAAEMSVSNLVRRRTNSRGKWLALVLDGLPYACWIYIQSDNAFSTSVSPMRTPLHRRK